MIKKSTAAGIFFVVTFFAFSTQVHAAQIKKIYRGTAAFDGTDVVNSADIGATVDTTKSLILINNSCESGTANDADQNYFFSAQFEDSSTISINRSGVSSTTYCGVTWQVVEFADGVTVQRGISSLQAKTLTKAIDLPSSIDTSKSFPIVYTQNTETGRTITHQLVVEPTLSSTQLTISRYASTGTKALTMTWQVVSLSYDADVYTGTLSLPVPGANTVNQTASTTLSLKNSGNNAMILVYPKPGTGLAGIDDQWTARGYITAGSPATLTVLRNTSTTTASTGVDVRYYVIDFNDGSQSQYGLIQAGTSGQLPTAVTTKTITSSTDATPIVITATAHGFSNGQLVNISGHATNTNAIGEWIVANATTNTFELLGSTATGSGAGTGGTAMAAITSALGTAIQADRTMSYVSCAGDAAAVDTSNTRMKNLSIVGMLTTVGATNYLSVNRSQQTNSIVLAGKCSYFTFEFPPLTLRAPNGGETAYVGTAYNITWKHAKELESGGTYGGSGPAHKCKLEVSADGGSTWLATPISSTVDCTADTYSWTPPASSDGVDLDDTDIRIRITDTDLASRNTDTSNANFTIKGTLTVTSPNTAAPNPSFIVGTNHTITWTNTGNLDDNGTVAIKLYSSSGTVLDSTILASGTVAPSAGTYTWNNGGNGVADKIGSAWRIGVEASWDAAGVNDKSDVDFPIYGRLTVTAPNSALTWNAQTSQDITWNKAGTFSGTGGSCGAGEYVNLYLSTNGGASYPTTLVTCQAGGTTSGSYNWSVPVSAISTTNRIKVESDQNSTLKVSDESDVDFAVQASIAITSPNLGTEIWRVGTTENITWSINGTINFVTLEYSTNSGGAWNTIVTGQTGSTGTYPWSIPDAIGDLVRVKVKDESAPTTRYDASDADFKIRGNITVLQPNGTSEWAVASSPTIQWSKSGSVGNVDILYSTNGGSSFPNSLVTNQTGTTWQWVDVPDVIGNTVQVRVRANNVAYAGDTYGDSPNFKIEGSVTITSPNGAEAWGAGTAHNITWTKTGTIGNLELKLSSNSGSTYPTTIVASTASDNDSSTAGHYAWTLPTTTGTAYKVKATILSDTTVYDESNTDFSIKGSVNLTAPDGGESWIVGANNNITWTYIGATNVKLELSTNGGTAGGGSYLAGGLIVSSTAAAALSYTWAVTDNIGTNNRIRISDAADASVSDESAATFTIKGSLDLTAPDGGTTYVVGATQNITWTKTGTIPNVKLEYSRNGFSDELQNVTIVASTPGSDLTYPWVINDDIGTGRKVRISNTADATVTDMSTSSFGIKGSITVTSPVGGEAWGITTSHNITWTKTGTLTGNLKLEYSINGGSTYPGGNLITNTQPASGSSYSWTIPDAPTTQGRVKITQLDDTTVNDESDGNFSIKGSLTLTAPNGGQTWIVGESRNITWTKGGSLSNVQLDLSSDSGGTYPTTITASTPAANLSYAWTIPNTISTTLRVKVTDTGDGTVNDESDADFAIKGSVTLTAPNGGESWVVGSSENITWTKTGTIPNVSLEYSTNAFADENETVTIVGSTPGANLSYAWTIPDAIDSSVKVRITNLSDTSVLDLSDATFTIKGSLTMSTPNGGQTWVVGESRNVIWAMTGSLANVKLEYSTNAFSNEAQTFTIVNSTAAETNPPAGTGSGQYAWTVADAIGTNIKLRVTNVDDATVTDVSDSALTITGSITLTQPNGSEIWNVGSSQNVTWTRTGSFANVKLMYSTDGGGTFPTTITNSTPADPVPTDNTGTYSWTIPDAITTLARVRAMDAADNNVSDDSDANFKIRGSLTLSAPNGGEKWVKSTSQNISWTKTGTIATVKLEYSTNAFSTEAQTVVIATGLNTVTATPYAWTIPDAVSQTVKVRVTNEADATVNDVSDANFKIMPAFAVSSPNGGEVWSVASSQTIGWTTDGTAGTVKIEYSTNAFLDESQTTTITASTSNTGSYSWTVPDSISTAVRVRVSHSSDAEAFDISNANFKIRGVLLLTAPNGGEAWGIGNSRNITWTRTGSIANVKLEYSTNAFANELETAVIIASTPADPAPVDNNGVYAWTIPDTPSSTARVRVSDASDSTAFDTSNGNFSIRGSVTLTAPNGTETGASAWIVATTRNITWTKFGAISNVSLEYSTDSGSTWPGGNLITASTPADPAPVDNNGTYSWTIPDAIGTQLQVRVRDAGDASVEDVSDGNFEIKGAIAVTSPNGGETWIVGDSNPITWGHDGSFLNVKLEYSTNAFANETQTNTILASTPNDGTQAWSIPDAIGSNLKVRASDAADALVVDVSNNPFEIKGSVTVTSPNGTEIWKVGEARNITWNRTGSVANVKLEYSTNGGSSFPNQIVASTDASTGTYAWTVPDAIGTQLRVKATSTADASVSDASDANFTIKGTLTITAPNGGNVWIVNASNNITWTKTGTISTVKLEYSTNAFADELQVTEIATGIDAVTGTPYSWTVPDAIGSSLKVRITNESDNTVTDVSNTNFKIVGSLTLTAPNTNVNWAVGSSQTVSWTRVGSIANVKLEYSTDSGSTYPNVIVASTGAGAGAYSWTIPDSIGSTRRVKVTDASDSTVSDTSDVDFSIIGGFAVTVPNGGEVWTVGSAQNLTWDTYGTVTDVKLEYSTNAFADESQVTVISASTTNTGTYSWTVANSISNLVRLRVSDASNANAKDISNASFKIRGALVVNAPNGGEAWLIGNHQNIQWTRTGSIANVKLEYSTNGFADETQTDVIIASTPADPAPSDNIGIYDWTIPDTPSATSKVRVTDASDSTVLDTSNSNFAIKGQVVMQIPNGGEVWTVATVQNVQWSKFGAISNVALQYSTDSGGTWPGGNLIVASTAADPAPTDNIGIYSWTIPDEIGTTLRVRVLDAADSSTYDDSNADFKIRGSVTITAPNGGENWNVGASQSITWNHAGSFNNVKLEYSTNAFANETQTTSITASTPNNGSFSWTIPDAIGTTLRVRATDVDDATVSDVSNANFTIKGSLDVTSPDGSEVWKVGESRNITWNRSGSIANVKLEYSVNGGSSFPNTIIASTGASSGSYSWTVPDSIGTQLRVRVSDTSDATVNSVSNANFEIKGTVTVTAPNGSEVWAVGSQQSITWTKTGTFSTVKLEYSTNAFSDELQVTTIATGVDAATGSPYTWTIPDVIGTTLRVRISNEADTSGVKDVSDLNFKVVGSLTLTAPNGGENWGVGTNQTVTWDRVGSIANVKLDYSTNGGSTYPNVIVASTGAPAGAYIWTNIPDAVGSNRKVKISDASDSSVYDVSDANFSIMGSFNVTAPDGGEVWTVGSAQSITWNTTGTVSNVKLEYSTNAFSNETQTTQIIANTPNTGTYSWTVADAISNLVRVRVSDVNNANSANISSASFKIRGALAVTAPNGGEPWEIGTAQDVAWTRTGSIANVKLEFSTNAFADETQTAVIVASTAADPDPADNAGLYSWTIPDAPSTTTKVRVTDASDATVLDTSNSNFTIKGRLVLGVPNGSEVWVVAGVQNITWTKFGSISNVALYYSTDSGSTWPGANQIVASTAADPAPLDNNGFYSWTIPDRIGTQLRVRVQDAADSSTYDDSNADFKIRGSVTITAPNGGELWIVGSTENITWTSTGSYSNVKLEYSTNGFSNESQTFSITSSTPNDGTFGWAIPDAIGTSVKVRASDAADNTVVDTSNAVFTIKGSLSLTSPNGSELWKVGESRNITWNRTGSIANVKLEYSTNGGSSYPNSIVASTDASTGTYAWTVADAIGTQLRVKVSDTTDTTVNDTSDANFEIKGTVTLTSPNGGEVWIVAEHRNLTWTKTGTYSTVKLEYSTNGFTDELQVTTIATGVDAVNGTPYDWTVPDVIGTALKVRVTNESDAAVVDASNLNFKIAGSLTLSAPNGGESWAVGTSKTITWVRVGSIANAKLEYSTDGGSTYPNVIQASTGAAAQAYIWTVPDAIGSNRRVKISDASDATVFDESNANFTIMGAFAVTAPNGGEVWTVASAQSVTWSTTGTVANVKLELSTNAFSDETQTSTMIASTPNTGTYSWTVSDNISNLIKVRVSDVNNANANDISNAVFKIRGALLVNAPNGGEPWEIGTNQNIQWTRTGSIANVKLEYSTNAFVDELQTAVIIASTPADPAPSDNIGLYSWSIPDTPSTTNKVRVTDASDATVLDTSNANFIIKGRLVMQIPNGSEVWTVAGVQNIQWQKFGAISNVQLQYSTDSGNTWPAPNIIISSTAADPAPADNIGVYSWTIPDAIGTNNRVRVQDAADSSTYDDSDADFKIRGAITMTAPNGGEVWIVGTNENVTWNHAGSFANVMLEYSTNAFADELETFSITTATPNDGSFSWAIPDAIDSSVRVRASDASDSTVNDISNSNFTIKGSLTLTSPNGAELWKVGESRAITWNRAGSIANVKLEYSTNGGSTFPNTIIASTGAGSGTYSWTVADAIGSQLRVRVTDVTDSSVNDSSDANFEIKGTVRLIAPNGGEQWAVNTVQNLTWTKTGTYSTVKLEYSTNAFADELQTTVIATGVDSVTGTPYAWTVPDVIGSTVRVRVSNESDLTGVTDKSDNNFKIVGSLTVTAPNGGQNWNVGTSQTVSWTRVGSIANVKIEYSTNGGTDYTNLVVSSTAAGAGAYSWTVPDSIGTNRRVKVTDVTDSTVYDTSDADFAIVATFTVTQPNGGEVWTVGTTQNITWSTNGSVANVKLEYSTDGGTNYDQTIINSTPNNATYSWIIPDSISTLVKVRVSDVNNANGNDTSNAVFKIRGALLLTAPNGSEQWGIGVANNITWTRTGSIANVKLEYSSNAFANETQTTIIVASTPADPAPSDNNGIYSWTIPDDPGTNNKVRVTDVSDSTVLDLSNNVFSIKGSVTIVTPNGTETGFSAWIVGTPYNITWTKGGAITNVKLQYSTDGGSTWPDPSKVIVSSTSAGFLSYTWTIPDDITAQGRVRILDANDNSVNDMSDANFHIKGSLHLTSPNGDEIWTVGDTQPVTWTKTGTIANVKLEYSTDGGSNYDGSISTSTSASAGTFNWVIPDSMSSNVRVKVTQTNDSYVTDASDANCKIQGSLTVTSPDGGEVWKVAASQPITWTKTGSISTVKIEYSVNGGATFPNSIATGVDAASGSYSWTIPNSITTNARVRITNEADATVKDASNGDFKISGSVTVVQPNGGEKWGIGQTKQITWNITGSISGVKLEYSTDGGSTYPNTISASVDATSGTPYSWVIPDSPTTQGRVKITNTADTTVFDISNANFKIQGSVDLTQPNGSEAWTVGTLQSIAWTKAGSFANVKLEYSTNSGSTYPNIITASTPSDNLSYAWTVPDNISTTIRVKVTDANDSEVTDASVNDFTIRGAFVVTAPNGGEIWRVGQAQNITWTVTGSVQAAKLEYSTNGFADETQTTQIVSTTPASNLSYAWNIPDNISNSVKIRMTDVDGISVGDTSNGNFAIKGLITLTSPNGGESYGVNSAQNITWSRTGSFANVKLEYSTNAFADESQSNLITASTPADPAPVDNTGTYAWTVPDAISTTVKVRVTDANDAATTDTSNNSFTIRGVLTITAPNGGEKWIVGTSQLITWDRQGSISNVKLQYTTNGTIFTDIIGSTPNTGTYSWTIPNSVSTTVKVRIYDASNATVTDDSNANFKIQAGFTLSSPNGGEAWLVGSTQSLSWTTFGTVPFVRLDYSLDSGANYNDAITTSTANTGSYSWTIPDDPSGTVRVRVADTNDVTAFDESNGDLRIRVAYSIVTPNGSEQWRVGRSQNITWGATGTTPNVKLQYSRDGFFADIQSITASSPNTGSYAWTIPDSISNTVRVKISDPNDIGAYDISNSDFRITGDFAITSPNGTEKWDVDDDHDITWTHAGTVPNAKLEYSTNAGGSWNPIVGLTPNNGTYTWTVPDSITAQGRVQISDPNDTTANDFSDANFKIKAKFTLSSPNGTEIWTVAEIHAITWTNTGTINNVRLWYSTDSGATFPNVIIASTANTGTYNWTVPDAISTNVRVRVGSTTDVDAYDDSDANLKIRGKFQITAPNGAESWRIAQVSNITWTTTGTISNVKIYYSTNGGSAYPNVIVASVANTNTYSWTVPDVPTTTARIRVENTADSTVYDDSDANFKIQGNFILNSPNGGEAWIVDSVQNIDWNWGGTIPNVKLTYSTDSGANYSNVINASAPNGAGSAGNATYAWTIPDAIGSNVRVKIEDPNDSDVFDASAADFKIRGDFNMLTPAGGERWITYDTEDITWSSTGTIPTVKLTYSHDNFATSNLIIASVANANSYSWAIPDPGINNIPKSTRVRVEDTRDSTVNVTSAAFNIDYYYITWDIRDLLTNAPLSDLTVKQTKNTDETFVQWQETGVSTTTPRVQPTPYGMWGTVFTKTGYGDLVVVVTADHDQSFSLFMETTVIHLWLADSQVSYDPGARTLSIQAWLSRDGSLIAGSAVSATLRVYDGDTLLDSIVLTPSVAKPGYFAKVVDAGPSGLNLQSGRVYTTLCEMPIVSGGIFKTPSSFEITTTKKIQEMQDTVAAVLDKPLSAVENAIRTDMTNQLNTLSTNVSNQLTAQTTLIDTSLTNTRNVLVTKMDEQTQTINTAIDEFTKKSDTAVFRMEDSITAGAIRLIVADATKVGFTERIQVSTDENAAVTTEFFCPNGELIGVDAPMFAVGGGRFTTSVKFDAQRFKCAVAKAVTIVATATVPSKDPEKPPFTTQAVKSMFLVTATNDDVIASTASIGSIASKVTETQEAVQKLGQSLKGTGNIAESIAALQQSVDKFPSLLKSSEGNANQLKQTLDEIAAKLNGFLGNDGIDLKSVLKQEIGEGMKGVRNKVDRTLAATQIVQKIAEQKLGGSDSPVVSSYYETA